MATTSLLCTTDLAASSDAPKQTMAASSDAPNQTMAVTQASVAQATCHVRQSQAHTWEIVPKTTNIATLSKSARKKLRKAQRAMEEAAAGKASKQLQAEKQSAIKEWNAARDASNRVAYMATTSVVCTTDLVAITAPVTSAPSDVPNRTIAAPGASQTALVQTTQHEWQTQKPIWQIEPKNERPKSKRAIARLNARKAKQAAQGSLQPQATGPSDLKKVAAARPNTCFSPALTQLMYTNPAAAVAKIIKAPQPSTSTQMEPKLRSKPRGKRAGKAVMAASTALAVARPTKLNKQARPNVNPPRSTPKRFEDPSSTGDTVDPHAADLQVAIVTEPFKGISFKQAAQIEEIIGERLTEEVLKTRTGGSKVVAAFRGRPFHSEGGLKMWCEDEFALEWLRRTVENIPSPREGTRLVVRRLNEIPRKVKSALFVPKADISKPGAIDRIRSLLAAQNPWYNVNSWNLYHAEPQGKDPPGLFLLLGIPQEDIENLIKRDRRVCYKIGSIYMRFFNDALGGGLHNEPPVFPKPKNKAPMCNPASTQISSTHTEQTSHHAKPGGVNTAQQTRNHEGDKNTAPQTSHHPGGDNTAQKPWHQIDSDNTAKQTRSHMDGVNTVQQTKNHPGGNNTAQQTSHHTGSACTGQQTWHQTSGDNTAQQSWHQTDSDITTYQARHPRGDDNTAQQARSFPDNSNTSQPLWHQTDRDNTAHQPWDHRDDDNSTRQKRNYADGDNSGQETIYHYNSDNTAQQSWRHKGIDNIAQDTRNHPDGDNTAQQTWHQTYSDTTAYQPWHRRGDYNTAQQTKNHPDDDNFRQKTMYHTSSTAQPWRQTDSDNDPHQPWHQRSYDNTAQHTRNYSDDDDTVQQTWHQTEDDNSWHYSNSDHTAQKSWHHSDNDKTARQTRNYSDDDNTTHQSWHNTSDNIAQQSRHLIDSDNTAHESWHRRGDDNTVEQAKNYLDDDSTSQQSWRHKGGDSDSIAQQSWHRTSDDNTKQGTLQRTSGDNIAQLSWHRTSGENTAQHTWHRPSDDNTKQGTLQRTSGDNIAQQSWHRTSGESTTQSAFGRIPDPKSLQKKRKTQIDVDSLQTEYESDEQWKMRRIFMMEHKDKFDQEELTSLAQQFVNIHLLGCRYPPETMSVIAKLSDSVLSKYRESRRHTLKRTLNASDGDAAEQKSKRNF